MRRLARLASLLLVAAAALGAAGCFNKEEQTTLGETEGIYVTVDDLKYQVQISRILDPASPEDAAYLRGVPGGEGDPGQDEVWFAVFMRVENDSEEPHATAEEFTIKDTQDNEFEPIELDPELQPLRLRAGRSSRPGTLTARAQLARRGQHDPRPAPALQAQDRVARQPPRRAGDRQPERRRGRGHRPRHLAALSGPGPR